MRTWRNGGPKLEQIGAETRPDFGLAPPLSTGWGTEFLWHLHHRYRSSSLTLLRIILCGSVAEWLGSRTCDQQVAGSNPGRRTAECNPGQVVYTHVPLSPSSIIWYHRMGYFMLLVYYIGILYYIILYIILVVLGGWGGNRGPGGK